MTKLLACTDVAMQLMAPAHRYALSIGRRGCQPGIEMNRRCTLILTLIAIGLSVGVGLWFKKQLAIDRCLDGGGSWLYEFSRCDE